MTNKIQQGLFLVPTPLGNLGDMTLRAIDILNQVDLILAEDTRVSKNLLNHFNIQKPLLSFHSQNEHQMVSSVVVKLKEGKTIAIITDAGTPGISDPAYLLVKACRENDIYVSALPGATAFVPALVASGLPCEKFFFQGFLPQKKGRQSQLKFLSLLNTTVVLYESPHRLLKCLEELKVHFGPDRKACFVKEISKLFERYYCGSLLEIESQLNESKILGEWVIVIKSIDD